MPTTPNGLDVKCQQMVPPWLQRMRDIASKHLTEDVVDAIVTNQIEAAKKGDRNAIKFVFSQLMGGAALKGASFTQNNYTINRSPAKPLPPKGSSARIEALRKLAEEGRDLMEPDDDPVDLR